MQDGDNEHLPLLEPVRAAPVVQAQCPSVALTHFSRQDDFDRLSAIDLLGVVVDESIYMVASHDCNDPVNKERTINNAGINYNTHFPVNKIQVL